MTSGRRFAFPPRPHRGLALGYRALGAQDFTHLIELIRVEEPVVMIRVDHLRASLEVLERAKG